MVKRASTFIYLFFLLFCFSSYGQNDNIKWYNPADDAHFLMSGQGWASDQLKNTYDRLPARAETQVRDAVWNLSRHAAGVTLRFQSDAPEIKVRYQVSGNLEMRHMPATGVSGVDLYLRSNDTNGPLWCKGSYSFKDTIEYVYEELTSTWDAAHEYELYLPLYNHVKWMEIGIPTGYSFRALHNEVQKPIVVYGTSIAQGGCASRPGMAWTSILQRKVGRPVINLAFSGNGRLEPELIDFINEIEAALYVLDCLPNLTREELYPEAELRSRIRRSVEALKKEHPNTPVLLVQHAGYSGSMVRKSRHDTVDRINAVLKDMYDTLIEEGVSGLYFLSNQDINMCMDCTVDGTHQSDLGMQYYADAYERAVQKILK